jgi:ribosomal protein S27AE
VLLLVAHRTVVVAELSRRKHLHFELAKVGFKRELCARCAHAVVCAGADDARTGKTNAEKIIK